MSKKHDAKTEALGMPIGTASNRLRKLILFSFVCRLKLDNCYRCNKKILSVDDLSIEHKKPWMQANKPIATFFDLDNIAFSHLSCNVAAANRPNKKYFTKEEQRLGIRERDKKYWYSLGKEEQRRRRRKN